MINDIRTNGKNVVLLAALTIGAAVSATATTPVTRLGGMKFVAVQALFLYGAGGTSAKAYIQTSIDQGVTWLDIMCFAFATTAVNKVQAVIANVALAANITISDGALADNTILSGILGDRLRVKYVTTGTYTGATSLALNAYLHG